ncbi:MAG: hypothetical protein GC154_21840 [bacterium]|nr:hypothetical protein [bacterium]
MRRWFRPLLCLLFLAASACSGGRSGLFFVPPRESDALVIYDIMDPPTLDPARSWGVVDGRMVGLVFSNLVHFNHEAKVEPDLALDWTVEPDGKTYTFHLNPAARFSNGRAVIADDVAYSLRRALDPATAAANRWALEPIESIDVLGPQELRIQLKEPFAPFIGLLAMPIAAVVPREAVEECERQGVPFGENPLGSGPWIMEEWKHDRYIHFRRNEAYWGPKPNLPRLVYRVIPNHFTAVAEFETGNIGVVEELPDAEITRWRMHPDWAPYTGPVPLLNTDMMLFNCSKPDLANPMVRRALASLVPVEKVLACVRQGAGTISGGPIPPGIIGAEETVEPIRMESGEAQRVLQDAGLTSRPFTLLFPAKEGSVRATAELLQALWKRAGLDVRFVQLEWTTYRQALREGDFDAAYRGWYADYPDGDNFLYPLFHSSQIGQSNFTFNHDDEIDALIEASRHELDETRREEILRRVNRMIFERAPALFLWHRVNYYVRNPLVADYQPPHIFNGTRYLRERIIPLAEFEGAPKS